MIFTGYDPLRMKCVSLVLKYDSQNFKYVSLKEKYDSGAFFPLKAENVTIITSEMRVNLNEISRFSRKAVRGA